MDFGSLVDPKGDLALPTPRWHRLPLSFIFTPHYPLLGVILRSSSHWASKGCSSQVSLALSHW